MDGNMIETRRRIIASAPHIVTPTAGNPVSFAGNMVAPLKKCVVDFAPVQAGTGDPSPENVRPITGWAGLNVYQGNVYGFVQGGINDNNGSENSLGTRIKTDFIQYNGETSFRFAVKGLDSNSRIRTIHWYNSSKTWISAFFTDINQFPYTYSGTIPDGTAYIKIVVQYSDSSNIRPTDKYIGINNTTYPVMFPAEAGTVYGGTVDLVSGVLSVEWVGYTFNGSETFNGPSEKTGGVRFLSKMLIGLSESKRKYALCNILKTADNTISTITEPCLLIGSPPYQIEIYIPTGSIVSGNPTNQEFTAWLSNHNMTICAAVNTPITYQLTPQQIKTLIGTNNVWSDANGNINLQYWAH